MYSTDGSDLRTELNSNPNGHDFFGYEFKVLGDRLYFTYQNANGLSRLYSTNGSDLKRYAGMMPISLIVMDNRLFYVALDENGLSKLFSASENDLFQHSNFNPDGNDFDWDFWGNSNCNGIALMASNNLLLGNMYPANGTQSCTATIMVLQKK